MKKLILFATVLLSQLSTLAQFPVSNILPSGIIEDVYGDSLINSSALLKREGIKKVIVRRSPSTTGTVYLKKIEDINEDGNIYRSVICLPLKNGDTSSCSKDTFLYATNGRKELRAGDAKVEYMRLITEPMSENEIKDSTILKDHAPVSVYYRTYNAKNQLIKRRQVMEGKENEVVYLFYNEDGIIDSIQHPNSRWGTFVFKQKHKRKTNEIEMENSNARYKWIYNLAGQCTSTEIEFKWGPKVKNGSNREMKNTFSYNPDGTLASVTNKVTGQDKITMNYSYSK